MHGWSIAEDLPSDRLARHCSARAPEPKFSYTWNSPVPDYSGGLDGNIRSLKVGVIRELLYSEAVDSEVRDAVVKATAVLGESGAEVEEISDLMDVELPDVILVGDVMRRKARSVTPETTLGEAASMMTRYHLGSIPVLSDEGEVLGMVSGRDLLALALPRYLKEIRTGVGRTSSETELDEEDQAVDPENVPVREVMDRSVLCLSEGQSLGEVAALMVAKDTDRFPVARDGILVGMLTRSGVVRLLFGT